MRRFRLPWSRQCQTFRRRFPLHNIRVSVRIEKLVVLRYQTWSTVWIEVSELFASECRYHFARLLFRTKQKFLLLSFRLQSNVKGEKAESETRHVRNGIVSTNQNWAAVIRREQSTESPIERMERYTNDNVDKAWRDRNRWNEAATDNGASNYTGKFSDQTTEAYQSYRTDTSWLWTGSHAHPQIVEGQFEIG